MFGALGLGFVVCGFGFWVLGFGFGVSGWTVLLHTADVEQLFATGSCVRFRGLVVFEAHRLFYHSTLGLRAIKKEKEEVRGLGCRVYVVWFTAGDR